MRDARVPQAAAGLRLERRRRWHVRASPSQSLRSDRGCSPRMASVCSLQQCSGCILHLRCPEGAGTSVNDRGNTGESHVARLLKFAPPMCSVHSRTGQWACPATHAASSSAADGRRSASARSVSIGSIMRAPSHAIDHHRSKPSPEPILPRATKRIWFCEMLMAATTDPRRAALFRVPCPRWPTRIRRLGVPCASKKQANR